MLDRKKRMPPFLTCAGLVLVLWRGPVARGAGLQAKASNDLAKQFARAEAATQEREFARAEEEWQRVLELAPGSARAHHNLGMVFYLERKYPEAEQALRQALRIEPSLANARVLLGASLMREGRPDSAIAELERAIKSRLNDAAERRARVALHDAFVTKGDYARALDALRPLGDKYPRDVDVLYSLGETYLQLAAQYFAQIEIVDPQSYRVHQVLAETLAKQGNYREAIREYRLALEKRPDLPGLHYQLGMLYWRNEQTVSGEDAARKEFEEELKLNPYDAWSEYRLGQIDSKRQQMESAGVHFRRAIFIDGSFVLPRLGLARILEVGGNLEEARANLEEAAKNSPESAPVHYRLAELYKKLGNAELASRHLKKFEEIRAGQPSAQRELEKTLRLLAQPDTEAPNEQDP